MARRFDCSAYALVYGAAMVLILPLNWVVSFCLAALVHELFHYGAIRLAGGSVHGIFIAHDGAVMHTSPLTMRQELLCALAGPAGSLLLFLCHRRIPRVALCAGVQGVFNLLPLYPLDGGRVFRILMERWFPQKADTICQGMAYLLILSGFLLGLWLCFGMGLGIAAVFPPMVLVSLRLAEKFLANRGK